MNDMSQTVTETETVVAAAEKRRQRMRSVAIALGLGFLVMHVLRGHDRASWRERREPSDLNLGSQS